MNRSANFDIIRNTEDFVILQDLGPWDQYLTITNAAESVVEFICSMPEVWSNNKRLLYFDSEGDLTELKVKNNKFNGFGFVGVNEASV